MRKQRISFAIVIVLSACGILAAASTPAAGDTFDWSGELVSFDAGAKTATVKARAVDQQALADLKRFKAGDRVLLLWSGYDKYADAIRRVMPYGEERKNDDRFLLPVELVSTDAPHQYVTFRVRVPDASVTSVKSVRAGDWVTVTSSHRADRETEAVVAMRPYVMSSAATTN
jgi:hypothetical protein